MCMLNDIPTGTMTVLRLAIKAPKVSGNLISRNPHSFPQIVEIIFPLVSLWNYQTYKN